MLSSLLITLREGLEAALIIGIVLAYIGYLSFSLVAYFRPAKFMKRGELKENVKHHVYVEIG